MSRSQSSPDIYKVTVSRTNAKSLDEELLDLCNLSGVTLDPDVFKILLDLIKLNVPPTSLVSVLKQIAATKGYRSETSAHSVLSAKLSSGSTGSSSYDTLQSHSGFSSLSTGASSSLTTTQSTTRSERIPISSRLREMRAQALQQ
ncbi:Mitotic-spindle organizing gamma-tubulin ring associated [Desmophyllum pertusum]|uniref:Mitotic-spindle organizing gamma-tubulin ring associated n=1 Tax=Desmophyllum pertusum TaxID=174260 RepID=A0A9X0D522_9CNID|nr:Mitotic-spindle organizing gamma-tubulin ring associated [Desmophyllum pertusum]